MIETALVHTELSPRELACRIPDREGEFLSESSVYRILKAADQSLEYLAFNSGISEEEFEERLQELEQRKWISRSGPPEAINVGVTGFLREIGRRAGKV